MSADERVFWRSQTCSVWVGYDEAGALVFNGIDREHFDGYEYSMIRPPTSLTWCATMPTTSWRVANARGWTTAA